MLVTVEFELRPGMDSDFEVALAEAHECVKRYDGSLGEEPCRSLLNENKFVTLFYFRDRESIEAWRKDADHQRIQRLGREKMFDWYKIRIAEVERQYGFNESKDPGLPTE